MVTCWNNFFFYFQIDDGNEPYLKWIGDTVSAPITKNDGNPEEKKQKLDEWWINIKYTL